jgi:hypothetical protein
MRRDGNAKRHPTLGTVGRPFDQPALKETTMRVLPIMMAAAIGAFATAAVAQQAPGPGSNQPPGQATTTQSSEQRMDADGKGMKHKKGKKTAKKMKKSM